MAANSSADARCKTAANADVVEQRPDSAHVDALDACAAGDCDALARYFRSGPPNALVLEWIRHALEGDANLVLRFTTRNGRPPALEGCGFERGQEAALARDLRSEPPVDVLAALADALDPKASTKWKLAFESERDRRGNPSTEIRNGLVLSWEGLEAISLRPVLGGYKRVAHQLGLSMRQLFRALAFVRKPPE